MSNPPLQSEQRASYGAMDLSDHPSDKSGTPVDHLGKHRQYWRDIILGVNDGLVSTLLLVAGVAGGGLSSIDILLTAIAGAIAGAVSMCAGGSKLFVEVILFDILQTLLSPFTCCSLLSASFTEYVATKSQNEVLRWGDCTREKTHSTKSKR